MKQKWARLKQEAGLILRGYRLYGEMGLGPCLLFRAAAAAIGAAAPLITLYFSGEIINELTTAREPRRLIWLAALTVGLALLTNLLRQCFARRAERGEIIWPRMYMVFAKKMLDMDYEDVEDVRVQEELDAIKQLHNWNGQGLFRLYDVLDRLARGLVGMLCSLTMVFGLFLVPAGPVSGIGAVFASHWGTLLLVGLLAASVAVFQKCSGGNSKIWSGLSENMTLLNRLFMYYHFDLPDDHKQGKDIRLYGEAPMLKMELEKNSENSFQAMESRAGDLARLRFWESAMPYLLSGAVYLVVTAKAWCGAIGLGGVVQYVGAVERFAGSFQEFVGALTSLASNNQYLRRVFDFLDKPNKKYQGSLPTEKRDDNDYLIEFRDVSFRYPGTEVWALRHLSLRLRIGERLAVVGRNGSGKTTMIKLLCRLYDPTEGEITLNGINIKKYNYDEYLALFSVVFQDFHLFSFPLGQSVAASVRVDQTRASQALEQAGMKERLAQMPQGLDTYLNKDFDDSGVELSGGESQKTAIARALYKEAPFLVLDEPTAALDPVAEYETYRRFGEMAGNKTAVCISHRLSSCRFCDRIAVFHKGTLVQMGTHESLLAQVGGTYQKLWNAQAQYYAADGIEVPGV